MRACEPLKEWLNVSYCSIQKKKHPNHFITTYSMYSMLTESKHDLFFRNMCLWLGQNYGCEATIQVREYSDI